MSVTSLNLVNPYIVGRPIYEPELFFGRRKLFRFIEDNLRQGVQVILLHGQRRIGKSSVLMQIPNFVGKDNFIFIYFDLHDKSNLPLSSVLQSLAVAINQKLDQLGLSSFADEPFSVTSLEASLYESNYPKLFLNEFLPKVIDILAQNNQKIVLLLDEFDVLNNQSLGSLTEQFFVYLQSLINQYSELFLIPVVGRRIEDLDNLKSLFKQAPNHEIGLLDTKIEAKDLILKPVANSLKYEDDAVTEILELTSGHAYLTQAVCYSLFLQAEEEEKSVITAADVKSIVDDAIELAEGGLAWFRDGLPISERVVFSAVAQAEKVADKDLDKAIEEPLKLLREYGVITTTALSKAPENLVQWGFLERVEDSEFRYKVKVKLVRYWLTKSYPLRQAIWELKDADLEAQKLFDLATEVSEHRNLSLSNFYETVLELNPNHFPTLFKLAEVYLDVKDFEKSKNNYKRAYEVDPTRADEGYKLAQKGFIPIERKSIIRKFIIGILTLNLMVMVFIFSYLAKQGEAKPNCLLDKDCITLIKVATVTDIDSKDFAEGTLTVSLIKGASPDDRIFIYYPGKNDNSDDTGEDIRVNGNQVSFQGKIIGSFQGGRGTEPLLIKFNQKATPASVEALLPRIVYQNLSASQNIGSRSIQVQLNDGDNGTSKPILETVLVINKSNAPSVTVPSGLSVKENKPLNISGIVINDPNSQNATVTLAVANGTLVINSNVAQGLKAKDITGNKTKQVILKGKLTEINATLAYPSAILYQSAKNFTGNDSLNITVNDNEKNSKQKGILLYPPNTQDASTTSGKVGIIVNPENAPSIAKFPSAQTVNEDSKLEIGGIVVKASNAKNPNSVNVALKVENGTLSIKDKVAKELTSANIKGNKSSEVILTGNIAQINTTLGDAAAIIYQGNNDFNGLDSFKITVSDGKHSVTGIVGITVNPVNDPPIVDIPKPLRPSDGSSTQTSGSTTFGSTNATIAGEPGQKNIRRGPGVEYSTSLIVYPGDRVQVIETKRNSDNFLWYHIYFPQTGADGWIAGNLLAVDGQTNATVGGNPGTKNLRSGAGTIYRVIGKVSTGDRVQIMGSSYDQGGYQWFQVYDPQSGTKGWIAAPLISRD